MKPSSQHYLFDASASYRIRVQGHLDANWADALCGMTIRTRRPRGKHPVTTLCGMLIDQASLMGVLTTLYEMGYTLLDLKRLPEPAASNASPSNGSA